MESTVRCARCDQEVAATEPACPACGHLHQGPVPCARHPDASAQGVCVICGTPACAECDTNDSVACACPDHSHIHVTEGWAQVYSTADSVEAGLIRDNLQSEGIDAAVLSQKDRTWAVDLGELSQIRILVPAFAYLDATKLLAAHRDTAGEVVFACPACGEAFDEGATTCRSCGVALPVMG
jgi:hypothetical protein